MMPGINPAQMKQMMKKMGIKQEEIEADEIIIKGPQSYIIKNPEVLKVNMMGQESLQITGKLEEYEEPQEAKITEEDVKVVMEQAGVSHSQAKQALEESQGDIAAAIISLKEE